MLPKIIIDCDPGVDDAFALMMLFPHAQVLGITTVGGNVPLAFTEKNARYITEITGHTEIPVYAGYGQPMIAPLRTASDVHGPEGLGSERLPTLHKPLEKEHAVDYLARIFLSQDDITLITLGPLTNIAQALLKEPLLKARIPRIVMMGGSATCGNHTPTAEFNIAVDPEAAKIVFESGIPIQMAGLNLARQCDMRDEDTEACAAIPNAPSQLAARLLDFSLHRRSCNAGSRVSLCDACAAAWFIDPTIVRSLPMHVAVETKGQYTRGMTVCDYRHLLTTDPLIDIGRVQSLATDSLPPNVDVAMEFDLPRFKKLLLDTLRTYS